MEPETATTQTGNIPHQENPPVAVNVTSVEAEPVGSEDSLIDIDPDRRLSWTVWLAPIALLAFNRKLAIVLLIILVMFQLVPRLTRKSKSPNRSGS